MLFEEDWGDQAPPSRPKYSKQEAQTIFDRVFIRLVDFYDVGVLQDMRGPASINCINGKRVVFTAAEYSVELVDPSNDAEKLAKMLAGIPLDYVPQTNPNTFSPEWNSPVAYISLYAWRDDGEVGTLRAARLTYETLERYHTK